MIHFLKYEPPLNVSAGSAVKQHGAFNITEVVLVLGTIRLISVIAIVIVVSSRRRQFLLYKRHAAF